jgi:protein-disulfide isomerase
MSPANDPRKSKAERTAEARENARRIREAQVKKEQRNRWLIRGGVLVAALLIVVLIAVIVVVNTKNNAPVADSGPVPANANVHGGVVLGKDNVVIGPGTAAGDVNVADVPKSPSPTASGAALIPPGIAATPKGQPAQIVAFVDFLCPFCNKFEQTYGADLKTWRDEGTATVEDRAFGFLDKNTTTNYSSRAANAAACVVNASPEKYNDYFQKLFAEQPAENSAGLSNSDLAKAAKDVGAADITDCVNNGTYRPFVKVATAEAEAYGVSSTPTVYVDGQKWDGSTDFKAWAQGIIDAKNK